MPKTSTREKYAALGEKLKVLETVTFSDKEWTALAAGAKNELKPEFRSALPIIVAQFKHAAAEEIMGWAQRQNARIGVGGKIPVPAVQDYKDDIGLIDTALFGKRELYTDFDIGKFAQPKVGDIHADDGGDRPSHVYVTRLAALPTYFIRPTELDALSARDKQGALALIDQAAHRYSDLPLQPKTIEAKKELIEMGVLKALPLGAVGLMARRCADVEGTLHCSSELPFKKGKIQPDFSAFLRSVTL